MAEATRTSPFSEVSPVGPWGPVDIPRLCKGCSCGGIKADDIATCPSILSPLQLLQAFKLQAVFMAKEIRVGSEWTRHLCKRRQ